MNEINVLNRPMDEEIKQVEEWIEKRVKNLHFEVTREESVYSIKVLLSDYDPVSEQRFYCFFLVSDHYLSRFLYENFTDYIRYQLNHAVYEMGKMRYLLDITE